MRESLILILGLFVVTLEAFPHVTDDSSLVVSSTTPTINPSKEAHNDKYVIPKIYDMRIDCNVSNRFAKSLITSKVKNLDKAAHEAVFSVVIPDQAFISGFVMEIDGKSYEAYVQEKEKAKDTYKAAVASGLSAGHVAVSARDTNRFTVSVNIEPQSKVTFYLKYEELLRRVEDKYQIVINIHPGQPVPNLQAKVHIAESRPLKFVTTPSLKTGNEIAKEDEALNPNAQIEIINKTSAEVIFSPNVEEQKQYATALGTEEDEGFAGQFLVEYDVERDPQGGEVLVDSGYFVHFFGSDDIAPLPKQVVFVLDTSGSMGGIRIAQLKEAMKSILSELKEEDVFNIVEFNSIVKVWNVEAVAVQYESGTSYSWWNSASEDKENPFKNRTEQPLPPAYPANKQLIKKAEQVVDKLVALGGTDIETALKTGIQLVEKNVKDDKKHQSIIIFLTDGEPTVGETNTEKITSTISELNIGKTPIFSLSFGDGADRKFLEKISLKNFGFARHIYEAADASLQLKKFYKQISSPLLSNVTFHYVSNVTSVTKRQFPILFRGSELVVAGIINNGEEFKSPTVEGWGINGPVVLIPKVESAVSSIERLWAYLTLKQILEQREQETNKTGTTQEALRIALKYSLVSDVSSLVVVKPNKTDAVDTEDGSKSDKYGFLGHPYLLSGNVPLQNRFVGSSQQFSLGGGGFISGGPLSFAPLAGSIAPHYAGSGGGFISGGPLRFEPLSGSSAPDYAGSSVNADRMNAALPEMYDSEDLLVQTEKITALSTTTKPVAVTSPENILLDILIQQLPWITSILNSNNTVNLSSGTYELGLNETLTEKPECMNAPSKQNGECVLLFKCPEIFTQIVDQKSYEKYFCTVQNFRYAGICCPKSSENE